MKSKTANSGCFAFHSAARMRSFLVVDRRPGMSRPFMFARCPTVVMPHLIRRACVLAPISIWRRGKTGGEFSEDGPSPSPLATPMSVPARDHRPGKRGRRGCAPEHSSRPSRTHLSTNVSKFVIHVGCLVERIQRRLVFWFGGHLVECVCVTSLYYLFKSVVLLTATAYSRSYGGSLASYPPS